MRRPREHALDTTHSSRVDADRLEKLFRFARQDQFTNPRRQAVLVLLSAELRRAWECYEKVR
jgi:hypothetical protein